MKIKIIKDFRTNFGWIRKGEEFTVRKFYQGPIPLYPNYQIIEGIKSGTFVPSECFIEIPTEKTYTEKEWNDMENEYLSELEKEQKSNEKLKKVNQCYLDEINKLNEELKVQKKANSILLDTFMQKSYESMRILEKAIQNG